MGQLAHVVEKSRAERIHKSLDHLNLVKQERKVYTDIIAKCNDMLGSCAWLTKSTRKVLCIKIHHY